MFGQSLHFFEIVRDFFTRTNIVHNLAEYPKNVNYGNLLGTTNFSGNLLAHFIGILAGWV